MNNLYKVIALVGSMSMSVAGQASDDLFANKVPAKETIVNVLTAAEKAEGWELLYDGKTSNGWRSLYNSDFPETGWSVSNGTLSVIDMNEEGGGCICDILSNKQYGDFILEMDYKITPGTNSGVKYFVSSKLLEEESIAIGVEFQIRDEIDLMKDYDEEMMGDPLIQVTGGIFNMITGDGSLYNADTPAIPVTPIGTWNRLRIVSKDNRVAHYLNGHKVVDYDRSSQMWRALVAYSKYADFENFGEHEKGYILLQDHGNEVHYRSIKIKELDK